MRVKFKDRIEMLSPSHQSAMEAGDEDEWVLAVPSKHAGLDMCQQTQRHDLS